MRVQIKFSRTHTYTLLPTGLALSARHLVDSALVLRRHAAVRVHGREAQPPAGWRELPTHPLRALAALSRLQCTVVRVHRGYRGGRVAAEGHAVQRAHARAELLDTRRGERVEPRVLLLDEPTAGMGPDERWQMIEKVQELWRQENMTLIFIEHDMDIVFAIAQRIRVLRYGALLADGTPDEIRSNPDVIEAYLGHSMDEAGDEADAGEVSA